MKPERFNKTKSVRGGHSGRVVAALVAVLSGVAAASYFVDDALAASGPAAPSITSEPSNPTTSTSAAFTFTDTSSPVTFKCSLDSATFATCSSGVSYSGLAQGSHTFKVEAISGSSTSSATSYSWAIVPPTPTITSEPSNPTTTTSASFKYSDTLAGVSFLCSLNGSSFSSCASSGVTYTVSNGGSNSFAVEAQVGSNTPSAAAQVGSNTPSGAASYTWTVTTPTPTINSKPANATNSTSAAFTYSDTQAGDSFKCSLDGASYSTCPSGGITYSGLSNATHIFGVEASLGSGPASIAASYSWLVHTTAPTITLTFPANGSYYNAAGWTAGCSTVGVCGTASDPVGVTSVGVAALQQSSGKYWNGSSFSSSSRAFNAAAITPSATTPWSYALARPADGIYTLYVEATDSLGNTTSTANLTTTQFTIATVAPPAPVIVGGGPSYDINPNDLTSPEFTVSDASYPNVTFTCKMDSGTPVACNGDTDNDGDPQVQGEWQYTNMSPGPHCFYVWATDKAGNVSPTTSYCWTVVGAPAAITEVSGSPQSATVHTAFANPLVAKVTDSHGDPVSGKSVTFSAPSSGASGTFSNGSSTITGTTGSNGEVSETFTANTTAGGPYAVTAKVSGVSSPADFSLTNTPAAASKLVFSTEPPVSSAATSTFSTTVSIEDSYGNVETGDSSTVALSLSTNACTGTLGGTTSKAATAGMVTFSGLQITKACTGYVLKATDATDGSLSTTSNAFNIVAGAAATIAVSSGSGQSATVHAAFAKPLVALVTDTYGNPVSGVTVTFKPPASGASVTFAGGTNTAVTSSSGLATSVTLTANTVAGTYNISAAAPTTNTVQFSETNTAGAATTIAVSSGSGQSAPVSTAFGAPLAAVVTDTYGNPVSGVTVTFKPPTSGASATFASGTNTAVTSSSGLATSVSLTANATAGSYSVAASAPGTNTVDFSLTNTAVTSPATKLVILPPAVSGPASSNASLGRITVQEQNASSTAVNAPAGGTVVTLSSSSTGTYIFNTTEGATSPTSSTTVTIPAGSSSVSFYYGDTLAGTPTITAKSGTLTPGTQVETITAATPNKLVYNPESPTTGTAGSTLTSFSVSVVDTYGNIETIGTGAGDAITLSLATEPTGGAFNSVSGTYTSVAALNGTATFSGIVLDTAGSYTFTATDTTRSLPTVTSAPPTVIIPAKASQLVFSTQPPASTAATSTFGVALTIEDAYGNIETTDDNNVALNLATDPCDGSLTGTTTEAAVSGRATFSNLQVVTACAGYQLMAIDGTDSLTSPLSNLFSITAATPAQLVYNPEPPTLGTAGSTLTSFSVSVEDTYGNTETTGTGASDAITLSLATKPTGGAFNSVSGTYSGVAALNGTATFSGVVLDTAGSYTFTATDSTTTLPTVTSTPPTVIGAAMPTELVYDPEPPTTGTAGSTLTSFSVSVEDTYGNIETTGTGASDAITLSLATEPTGGAFNSATGTYTAVAAVNGTANFSGIVLDTAGSYTFSAIDSTRTLPTVTSTPPTVINHGTPYAITVVSGNNQSTTQGVGFANPLVVKVTDQYHNPVSGASVKFGAPSSGASGTFSNSSDIITAPSLSDGTLSEGFTANDTGGPYTVTATAGALTAADFSLLNGMNFSITGNTSTAFTPGMTQSVDLSITNPNPSSDELTLNSSSLSLVVTPDAGHSGCQASWFTLNQGSWSVSAQGGTTEALSDLSVAPGNLPTVTMTDTNTDQDACKGATLSLHWSANGNGAP